MEIKQQPNNMLEPELVSNDIIFKDSLLVEDIKHLSRMTARTEFFSEEEVQIVDELAWSAVTEGEESDYSFLLALPETEDRAHLLGFACFGRIPGTDGSWALYWIVVDEQVQGQGYGRSILHEVERRICTRGARKIFLETSSREQYVSTRGFYEANGYLMESVLKDYYAQGEDCLVYTKNLK